MLTANPNTQTRLGLLSFCSENSRFFGVRKLACAFAARWCCDTKAAAGCRTANLHALGCAPGA